MESKAIAPKILEATPREKILLEMQPLMLPMILNMENLSLVGFLFVILIASVAFRFGPLEFAIIGLLYALIAIPSFVAIFRTGSTTYVLTNQRVVMFSFGIRQKERSIPLGQIHEVKCKSSGLQRFYGAGDIIIYQKGLRRPIKLVGLNNCRQHAEIIRQAVKKHALRPQSS